MIKIPGIFPRDVRRNGEYDLTQVNHGVAWVFAGEGVATQKFDGTAVAVIGGKLHKRFDAKPGRNIPTGAIPCGEADVKTKHWPHWVPVNYGSPEDWIHTEAWKALEGPLEDGTYELCGPRINENPEKLNTHLFLKHGGRVFDNVPLKLSPLRKWLKGRDIEGIVWHHPDGRMAKITKDGFGMKR